MPLPASGSAIIDFSCDISGNFSNNGTPVPFSSRANISMKVELASASGSTRVYDSEILRMDMLDGTLPAGSLLRESPTKRSYGEITINGLSGGNFRMAGIFDLFTELSTDGGNNWQQTDNQARVSFSDGNSTRFVPLLSGWILILLTSIILITGVLYLMKFRNFS